MSKKLHSLPLSIRRIIQLGGRWPSRLVATAEEDRLNFPSAHVVCGTQRLPEQSARPSKDSAGGVVFLDPGDVRDGGEGVRLGNAERRNLNNPVLLWRKLTAATRVKKPKQRTAGVSASESTAALKI